MGKGDLFNVWRFESTNTNAGGTVGSKKGLCGKMYGAAGSTTNVFSGPEIIKKLIVNEINNKVLLSKSRLQVI